MNSIVNHMGKYDHRQHVLSDWLAELEQRFQLGEVNTDKAKITWCQLLIGATGSSILAGLEDDATWEAAKETLLSRLGTGSVRDEAWASLKQLKRGSKEIIELAGEAEKLAKRLHPRDEEAAERHGVDAFLGALDRPLAAGSPETRLPHHGRSGRCPWVSGHGSLRDLHGVHYLVVLPRPMGSLEAVRGHSARCTWQTTTNCRQDSALGYTVGRSSWSGQLHCHCGPGVAALPHWYGHYAAAPSPHRRDQWHSHASST